MRRRMRGNLLGRTWNFNKRSGICQSESAALVSTRHLEFTLTSSLTTTCSSHSKTISRCFSLHKDASIHRRLTALLVHIRYEMASVDISSCQRRHASVPKQNSHAYCPEPLGKCLALRIRILARLAVSPIPSLHVALIGSSYSDTDEIR